MQSHYAKDMKQILAALNESGEEDTQQLPNEEAPHAYPVNIGGVEGVLLTREEVSPEFFADSTVVEQEEPDHASPARVEREPPYFLYYVLILCLFFVLDNVNSVLISLFTPTATITIIASEHVFSANAALTIPAHIYKQVYFTETRTILTTGKGHQNATYAHGYVTFYNSLPSPQTIDTGTLITGNDGVQISTDQTAYVPAGSFSGNGEVTVSAHAINPGQGGNIGVGDISGTCCREYILVRNNAAFTGGQDERDYQFVASSDMKDVQRMLFSKINGEKQKAQGQIPTTDTLLTPIPCSTGIQSNHKVGDEATSLTITVNQTCSIVSYSQKVFNEQLARELLNTIQARFGNTYTLLQSPTASITDAKVQQSQITFFTASTAVYGLDLGTSRTSALSSKIAGQNKQNALNILRSATGITNISLVLTNSNTSLPTDATQIHFIVIYRQSTS